jgi:hydroxymethylglutaryl-CoA reductase (NADPH)
MESVCEIVNMPHTPGSVENGEAFACFSLKSTMVDARLTGVECVSFNGVEVPRKDVAPDFDAGHGAHPARIEAKTAECAEFSNLMIAPAKAPVSEVVQHTGMVATMEPFGRLAPETDAMRAKKEGKALQIPRDKTDDRSGPAVAARRQFVERTSGASLKHVSQYSFDPHITACNIENFTGVAQIPMGFAGPLQINGEHALGQFIIPLATTEGTLVASYSRGMKVLNLCGGVKVSVVDDAMQRAPVFVFDDACGARDFIAWCRVHEDDIRREAESTSKVARLNHIDYYQASKLAFLRFNYTTGDAAGQNMVGKATFCACNWILMNHAGVRHHYLEANMATDKKASQVNLMHTRGKRVVAEATLKRSVLMEHLRVQPEALYCHYNIANAGAMLSGATNNGAHSANAIAAMFIATGQDVANVAESSAGILYMELTGEGDLYISITIPSLIVATYGGGTGLATQRECLELLGCYGEGKVRRLAEIVGGVVLAGEISLGAAISSLDWVSSHEQYGRNR